MSDYIDPRLDPSSPYYDAELANYYDYYLQEAYAADEQMAQSDPNASGGMGGAGALGGPLGLYAAYEALKPTAPAAAATVPAAAAPVADAASAIQYDPGITDYISNLFSGGAPSGLGDAYNLAASGIVPEGQISLLPGAVDSITPATQLGGAITSGLQGLGMGAETAGSLGGALGQGIPIAGGLYSGYNLLNNLMDNKKDPVGGALSGLGAGGSLYALGMMQPELLPVAVLAGLATGMTGSGKPESQKARDDVRENLLNAGIIGPDYSILGYDIGTEDPLADGRHRYDVDFSRSGVGNLVGALNPLGWISGGGRNTPGEQMTGYLVNAALESGKDPFSAALELYRQYGLTDPQSAINAVTQLKLSEDERAAAVNAINSLYGGGRSAIGAAGTAVGLDKYGKPVKQEAAKLPATTMSVGNKQPAPKLPAATMSVGNKQPARSPATGFSRPDARGVRLQKLTNSPLAQAYKRRYGR